MEWLSKSTANGVHPLPLPVKLATGLGDKMADHLRVRIGTESVVNQQSHIVRAPRVVGVENRLVGSQLGAISKAPVLDGT